jgi:hypothetical protein
LNGLTKTKARLLLCVTLPPLASCTLALARLDDRRCWSR